MAKHPRRAGIKQNRTYDYSEVAKALGVSRGTVRHWVKAKGLIALTEQRPHLVRGCDLIKFFDQRKASKQTCAIDECFCFSCKAPRKAKDQRGAFEPLTVSSGNFKAICIACGTRMFKRVSMARLPELQRLVTVTIEQGRRPISNGAVPSSNPHFKKETIA